MKYEGGRMDGQFIFSSGRRRYANCGVLGISLDAQAVSAGFDNGFWHDEMEDGDEPDSLSREDLLELADYLIDQATKFRQFIFRYEPREEKTEITP